MTTTDDRRRTALRCLDTLAERGPDEDSPTLMGEAQTHLLVAILDTLREGLSDDRADLALDLEAVRQGKAAALAERDEARRAVDRIRAERDVYESERDEAREALAAERTAATTDRNAARRQIAEIRSALAQLLGEPVADPLAAIERVRALRELVARNADRDRQELRDAVQALVDAGAFDPEQDAADAVRRLAAQRDALRATADATPRPEQTDSGTEGHPALHDHADGPHGCACPWPDGARGHVHAWPNLTRSCTCGAPPPDHRPRVVPPHPIAGLLGITADDLAERAEDVLPPPDPRTFPGLEQEWSRPL